VEFALFVTQDKMVVSQKITLTNEKCSISSESALQSHVWLDQVCTVFNVMVRLEFGLKLELE